MADMQKQVTISFSEQGAKKVQRSLEGIDKSSKNTASSLSTLKKATLGLFAVGTIKKIASQADAYADYRSKLILATGSIKAATEASKEILAIANQSGESLVSVGKAFDRINSSAKHLNRTQEENIELTRILANAASIEGKTLNDLDGVIKRFTKDMNGAAVTQELFVRISRATPGLLAAMADSMGVGVKQLYSMAAAGEITGQQVYDAIIQSGAAIDDMAGQTIPKFSDVINNLKNAWDETVSSMMQTEGVMGAINTIANVLIKNMEAMVRSTLAAAGAYMLFVKIPPLIVATRAAVVALTTSTKALTVAIASNPLGALATAAVLLLKGLIAIMPFMVAFSDKIKVTGDGAATLSDVLSVMWDGFKSGISTSIGFIEKFGISFSKIDLSVKGMVTRVAESMDWLVSKVRGVVDFLSKPLDPKKFTDFAGAWADSMAKGAAEQAGFFKKSAEGLSLWEKAEEKAQERIKKRQEEEERLNRTLRDSTDMNTEAIEKALAHEKALNTVIGGINNEIAALSMLKEAREAEAEVSRIVQEQQRAGIIFTDSEINQIREKINLLKEETKLADIRDEIRGRSIDNQIKEFEYRVKAMQQLREAQELSSVDAFQELNSSLGGLLDGTFSYYEAQAEQLNAYYSNVDQMRQADLITEQQASEAKLKIWAKEQEVKYAKAGEFFGALGQLQGSQNKKMAAIGKKAAIVEATINTYKSATAAYASMAGIPYVGPALGATAAAAAIAMGLQQVQQIQSQSLPGFKVGGQFEVGGAGQADSKLVQFMATPGETVTIETPNQRRSRLENNEKGGNNEVNMPVTVVQSFDPYIMIDAMDSAEGARVIESHISRNPGQFRRILGV